MTLILENIDSGDKKYFTSVVFRQTVLLCILLAYLSAKYLYDGKKISYFKHNIYKSTENFGV